MCVQARHASNKHPLLRSRRVQTLLSPALKHYCPPLCFALGIAVTRFAWKVPWAGFRYCWLTRSSDSSLRFDKKTPQRIHQATEGSSTWPVTTTLFFSWCSLDPWETVVSYIRLDCGKALTPPLLEGMGWKMFPTSKLQFQATQEDLLPCGLGKSRLGSRKLSSSISSPL